MSLKLFWYLDHLVSPIDGLSSDDIGPHYETVNIDKILDAVGEYLTVTLLYLVEVQFDSVIIGANIHEES